MRDYARVNVIMRTPVIDGRSIEQFIPAHLRGMFYKHPMPQYKYAIHDGYDPYGFSTEGLVLYLPLWALEGDSIKSVDARKHTCPITGALWKPYGRAFDGDDNIDLTNVLTTSLSSNTQGAISFWVRMADATPASDKFVLMFGDTDANTLLAFRINTEGKISCYSQTTGTAHWTLNSDNVVFADNTWVLITLDQNGTAPVLYTNDTQPAQTMDVNTDTTKWFGGIVGLDNGFFGKGSSNNSANQLPYIGDASEVFIYDKTKGLVGATQLFNTTKWRHQ